MLQVTGIVHCTSVWSVLEQEHIDRCPTHPEPFQSHPCPDLALYIPTNGEMQKSKSVHSKWCSCTTSQSVWKARVVVGLKGQGSSSTRHKDAVILDLSNSHHLHNWVNCMGCAVLFDFLKKVGALLKNWNPSYFQYRNYQNHEELHTILAGEEKDLSVINKKRRCLYP